MSSDFSIVFFFFSIYRFFHFNNRMAQLVKRLLNPERDGERNWRRVFFSCGRWLIEMLSPSRLGAASTRLAISPDVVRHNWIRMRIIKSKKQKILHFYVVSLLSSSIHASLLSRQTNFNSCFNSNYSLKQRSSVVILLTLFSAAFSPRLNKGKMENR